MWLFAPIGIYLIIKGKIRIFHSKGVHGWSVRALGVIYLLVSVPSLPTLFINKDTALDNPSYLYFYGDSGIFSEIVDFAPYLMLLLFIITLVVLLYGNKFTYKKEETRARERNSRKTFKYVVSMVIIFWIFMTFKIYEIDTTTIIPVLLFILLGIVSLSLGILYDMKDNNLFATKKHRRDEKDI